jgi:hypothetical protein
MILIHHEEHKEHEGCSYFDLVGFVVFVVQI